VLARPVPRGIIDDMTEVEPVERMDDDDDEGLGAGFYFRIAGLCLVCGIAAVILLRIFWRAIYAWGFFGGFIAIGILLFLFGWIYDRRDRRGRGPLPEE
jgi:uncharacterized membrane protein YedE/YeeE